MQELKNIKFDPGFKKGVVAVPSSKSIAHRALICAALAKEQSYIYRIDRSDDIDATINAMQTMGEHIEILEDKMTVVGADIARPPEDLDLDGLNGRAMRALTDNNIIINCKESGSTLRFLIPVAAALGLNATFIGEGSLLPRTIRLYEDLFKDKNVDLKLNNGRVPATVSGKLSAGKFHIPGNITSQFITGLLFALPLLDGNSEIILTSKLESAPYVDLTVDVLKIFGIVIHKTSNGYYINGNQHYLSATFIVEGDFSQAAFFAAAAAIHGDITIKRLAFRSLQGDYKIIDILNEFGAKIFFEGNVLRAVKGENLKGIKIDATQIPDLIPVLSVVAAYAHGETVIYNAERLRLKESDRIHAIYKMLTAIGANVQETSGGLIIGGTGGEKLPGGFVNSFNDHRIAMSAAVASINTINGVVVDDMSCINKSYPMFLRDFMGLDGK